MPKRGENITGAHKFRPAVKCIGSRQIFLQIRCEFFDCVLCLENEHQVRTFNNRTANELGDVDADEKGAPRSRLKKAVKTQKSFLMKERKVAQRRDQNFFLSCASDFAFAASCKCILASSFWRCRRKLSNAITRPSQYLRTSISC